jgi:hypothetical protein
MSVRFHRRTLAAIGRLTAALLAAAIGPGRAPAQVETANWSGTTGNWDNPNIWTTSPISGLFPNNGQPPGTTYNTQVVGSGTIILDGAFTISQLTFGPGAIAGPSGANALTVTGNLTIPGSASILTGTVNVGGTTSVNSTLTVGAGATLGGAGTLNVNSGGALVVQGTVSQQITVGPNGVLTNGVQGSNAFVGSPGNTLLIQPGGVVAPGDPSTITVGGNMKLNGTYDWDLNGNDNTMAGSTFDQINVMGSATLDPPAINVKFETTGTLSFADPFWAQPRTWLILDASTLTEVAAPTLTTSDNRYLAFYPEGSFTTEMQGNTGLLVVWNPVPEPGSMALASVGLAVAGWAARRRRSKSI